MQHHVRQNRIDPSPPAVTPLGQLPYKNPLSASTPQFSGFNINSSTSLSVLLSLGLCRLAPFIESRRSTAPCLPSTVKCWTQPIVPPSPHLPPRSSVLRIRNRLWPSQVPLPPSPRPLLTGIFPIDLHPPLQPLPDPLDIGGDPEYLNLGGCEGYPVHPHLVLVPI